MNTYTPAFMLCATGNQPLYQEIQPRYEDDLLTDGLPSHPLDAPAFAPAGGAFKYDDNPMHGIVLYAGRMG
jgi:hypothetical protein